MDYLDYDDQSQPSRQQQQPHSTTSIPHHPNHSHHQPAMNHSFQQHLQLQPVSQQHGAYLQPHHSQSVAASTAASPHLQHLPQAQGGLSVPFLHHGAPLGFASVRGGEVGTERSILHQDVPPISHRVQVRGVPQVMDSIFSSVIQEGVDPSVSHLEPPAPSSLEPEPSTPRQLPSHSTVTPTQPTTTPTRPVATPIQPSRPPLSEKPARMVNDGNLQRRNASQKLGKTGSAKKPMLHAILPEGFSYQFADKDGRTIQGVVVNRFIQKSQWFGPFNGTLLDEEAGQDIGSTWELCLQGNVWFYLDGKNKIHNNWLYHINPARTREEQNLEAFQHYGDIYFRALDNVQPGTELKVFYSDEYRKKIGFNMALSELNYQKDTDDFECKECKARCETSKKMLRHIKFTHEHKEGPSKQRPPQYIASSHSAKGATGTASDQLAHFAREVCHKKDVVQRTGERAASNSSLINKGGAVRNVERLSGGTLPHGNVHPSRSTNGPQARERAASKSSLINKGGAVRNVERLSGGSLPHGNVHPSRSINGPQALLRRTSTSKQAVQNVERLSGGTLPHGNVHPSRRPNGPQALSKRTSTSKQAAVLPRRVAPAPSSGDHVCPTCGKSFNHEGLLDSHRLFHRTQIKEFKCEVCGLVCKTFQEHIRHRNGHAERLHSCFLCENKYRYTSSYTRHLTNAHHINGRREKYTCRLCRQLVHGKMKVIAHRTVCTLLKRDNEQWSRVESEAEERSRAMKGHPQGSTDHQVDDVASDEEEPDHCEPHHSGMDDENGGWISEEEDPGCDEDREDLRCVDSASVIEDHHEASTSDLQLRRPEQKVGYTQEESDRLGRRFGYYETPRPFQCKYKTCHRSYAKKCDLLHHIRRFHRKKNLVLQVDPRPYKCEQCPRTFSSVKAQNNHKEDHTGAKPFQCEPCFKWFRTSRRLSEHNYRMHRDHVKKHECTVCGKKFLEPHALRKHERCHRGVRNFMCELCQRTFTSKHGLQTHMVRHTGEKPFSCEICGRTFSLNVYLVRHAVTHRLYKGTEQTDSTNEK